MTDPSRRPGGESRPSVTAMVATAGGHISELVELAERLPPGPQIWITNDGPQTRDLLAGRQVEYVPFIGERDLIGVLRAAPEARRIFRRWGVDRVISTGSAIALAYLPVAAAQGLEAHYIESSTRVESRSMTGRLLSRLPGVRCWWQYDPAPPGFEPAVGVYDGWEAVAQCRADRPLRRVVVTVGTTNRCFRRLIVQLIDILPPDVEVLWQTGRSRVDDLGIEARCLVPERELIEAMTAADVVVTHAGAGSLALALRTGNVPVFVPRRSAHDEQVDDHQAELALWAHRRGLAVAVEADRIELDHLRLAASRHVIRTPTEELVLT